MAANDYYYGNKPPSKTPSPSPYYDSGTYNAPSSHSTAAPPYSSTANLPDNAQRPSHASPVSPFESVFDDHVYPLDSRQQGSHNNAAQPAMYAQDTGYHGQASVAPESTRPHGTDDIPLQTRLPKDAVGMNDHVYDAAENGRASRGRKKKGKVGLGQLGMIGSDRKRIPWVVYLFTIVQVGVFIGEIVRNGILTGSPIMIKPTFNPMIGPSTFVMIEMGARYVPCMRNTPGIQNETIRITWPCPNSTSTDPNAGHNQCDLKEVCGFGGTVPNPKYNGDAHQKPEPNQWFRFILPMFLHAGLIHIGFNMLLQLTIGKEMEMAIGPIRFVLVYISSGIFGFVMGGNYAAPGVASTGASGSLFGIIALTLLDLLYSWKERRSPVKDLMFIFLDIVISFVLGLLPGLDNFSHIGGFLMGLCLGICVLHSPNSLRRRIGNDSSYASVNMGVNQGPPPFLKNPIGFFKGRKPLWWAWWLVRAAALILVIVVFIVLLNNFYIFQKTCDWCKYLSCLPVNGWCDLGNIRIENRTTTPADTKVGRELLSSGVKMAVPLFGL